MTPLFPAQRAAEEFDSVLEGRATTAVAERYAELAATVQVLRDQPEVLPRAEFVADLRERLMTAAETDMVPAAPVVRRACRRSPAATAASAPWPPPLVIVGGTAGMAAAASGALPGEALYPIKRGVEQVQIAAHFGDAVEGRGAARPGRHPPRRGRRTCSSSGRRPSAWSTPPSPTSAARPNAGADKLFRAYQADGDAADITTVRDFTASADGPGRRDVRRRRPVDDRARLRDAADTLADIDQQASDAVRRRAAAARRADAARRRWPPGRAPRR